MRQLKEGKVGLLASCKYWIGVILTGVVFILLKSSNIVLSRRRGSGFFKRHFNSRTSRIPFITDRDAFAIMAKTMFTCAATSSPANTSWLWLSSSATSIFRYMLRNITHIPKRYNNASKGSANGLRISGMEWKTTASSASIATCNVLPGSMETARPVCAIHRPHSITSYVDSVSIKFPRMCHAKKKKTFSQGVLCKLRCGGKLYSTVVRYNETKTL